MLGITVAPAQVWEAPSNDAVYAGFDSNLLYTSGGGGGSVRVTPSSIDMSAIPASNPSANLFTTPLKKMNASLDVLLTDNEAASEPFRIGVWSPWIGIGQFIVFGPPPQNAILAETISNGEPGRTLSGGQITEALTLGHYRLGTSYHLAVDVDKSNGLINTSISGSDGTQGRASLSRQQSPAIFGVVQISFTASARPGMGTSHAVLSNYRLTIPHQRAWASKISDPRASAIVMLLALAGLVAIGAGLFVHFRMTQRAPPSSARNHWRRLFNPWVVAAIVVYLVGNALLFPLGAQPFDISNQELYAYVARVYGTPQLFFLPNVVSIAKVWLGAPFLEFAFPYEPVTAYLSTAIGWLNSLIFAGGGAFPLDNRLQYVIKAVNVLFGLADTALIYLILRHIGMGERWSVIPAALFLFNPAVWFSMSVWGQTHVFSLFLVLLAVYFAERQQPIWAWLALAAGCLTRPQMLVFGLLLGIVFLRKFALRQNISALSWTVVISFVALVPLTLATSPSLPIDIMLHNFNVQEGGGNVVTLTTVSQGAYSIWPLITYLTHGTTGLLRAFTPSSETLVGSLTYQEAGQVLTALALLAIAAVLWFTKRLTNEPGAYLPFVAIGIASFLMLLTGIVSTHFLLALPFLLLSRRWMDSTAYVFVVAVWTVTTLVPMFGDLGVALFLSSSGDFLSPTHNAISKAVMDLYRWDRFITVGVVANVCALVWLVVLAMRPTTATRVSS